MLVPGWQLFGVTACALRLLTARGVTMAAADNWKNATSIYDFTVKDIKGEDVSLEKYSTPPASSRTCAALPLPPHAPVQHSPCLLTHLCSTPPASSPTCAALPLPPHPPAQHMHSYFRVKLPSLQPDLQEEPGSSEDIVCFAVERKVKFDLFEKVDVNGDNAHPLWKYLKHKKGGTLGDFIKWNFTKFIIDKNGQPVERHGPNTDPSKLVSSLEKYW
uniref:Glutathione peroxidase n=1 Tax=Timema genevievae TaxID=629358 RepID=A0A7R9K4G1_TIMGE|nr:unnamed protein product [Timema genevievae]